MGLEGSLAVEVDGTVEFAFTVTNANPAPVTLAFTSGFVADVFVVADGAEVWRWSDGRAFIQAIGTETLEPGESFVHTATWPDPRPGAYTAVATLEAETHEVEARTDFSV